MSNYTDTSLAINKVVSKVNLEDDCNVTITFTYKSKLLIYHVQECCEDVRLCPRTREDVEDLVEQYIDFLTIKIERKYSLITTFIFKTDYRNIRLSWFGESNVYYS